MEGQCSKIEEFELHDQFLTHYEHRCDEDIEESRTARLNTQSEKKSTSSVSLPNLALNEVFIGESLSARVSYYLMSIDDGPFFKQKSSGIIVCTGRTVKLALFKTQF